jgi:hypothetical protein
MRNPKVPNAPFSDKYREFVVSELLVMGVRAYTDRYMEPAKSTCYKWYDAAIAERAKEALKEPEQVPGIVASIYVMAARYAHHRETAAAFRVVSAIALMWDSLEEVQEQLLKESLEATTNKDDWARLKLLRVRRTKIETQRIMQQVIREKL